MRAATDAGSSSDGRTTDTGRTGGRPLVKLCGLRTLGDARAALAVNADYVGFVFAPSRRQVTPDAAASIVTTLRVEAHASGVAPPQIVGVFVNANAAAINDIVEQVGLDLVQLSGAEPTSLVAAITRPVVRVVHVSASDDLTTISDALRRAHNTGAALLLVDAAEPGEFGGTGRMLDWDMLEQARMQVERELAAPLPLLLAGGLTPDNVAAAIADVAPLGVDVSSGIETGGSKDPRRMRDFVVAAHSAMTGLPAGSASRWEVDERGRFGGAFGGAYVPETLMPAVRELTEAYGQALRDPAFQSELRRLLRDYVGRPTALTEAHRLAAQASGARIMLKREDLAHTGAHKINNAIGQGLLARRMGKRRIIAETGAGQHGVATATVCALLGLECIVYMGEEDIRRQQPNVFRMGMLGAEVRPVATGSRTLKDATNAAIRDWVGSVESTYYLIGSVVGMHPYPTIVRDFQRVIGDEVRHQLEHRFGVVGGLPGAIVACVGGGSNAIGIFHPFLEDASVRLFGAEAGGEGIDSGRHAATLVAGEVGVLHGARMHLLQNADGQVTETHSISAGLDYPGVGPEHSYLHSTGRASYSSVTDSEALAALHLLARTEGIICALESAHAIALALRVAPAMERDEILVVNLSGRGDKDLATIIEHGEQHAQ